MTIMPTNADVLKWAREIRRVTKEEAATKLEWDVAYLDAVEGGRIELDEAALQKLATAYKLPLATLLMPAKLDAERYPPRPIVDNRLHVDGRADVGIETQRFIANAWELLELAAELGETMQLPDCTLGTNEANIAAAERTRLGITVAEQLGWDSERTALLKWRTRFEEEGVIINALNIKEEDIRGFALWLDGAGYIAFNKNDERDRAKIYSIVHEYGHLLLRQSGLSDQNRRVPVERWCNQFAANFLLPGDAVREYCRVHNLLGGALGDYHVNRVSSAFKVSKATVAIRFEELGFAPQGFYERLKATWKAPRKQSGFDPEGDQVRKELNRYGTRHVSLVLQALNEGRINSVEARYALDVGPQYREQILTAARERQEAYGRRRAG